MDDEEFRRVLDFVSQSLGRGLKQSENCVLLAAWKDLTYLAVPGACPECNYSPGTLQRSTAPALWRSLEQSWQRGKVTKPTFRSTVTRLMAEPQPLPSPAAPSTGAEPSPEPFSPQRASPPHDLQYLGHDDVTFLGRTEELTQLRQVLNDENRRLVVLSGPRGVGKTWLIGKLLHDLVEPQAPFKRRVFYRRLEQVNTVEELYHQLLQFLSGHGERTAQTTDQSNLTSPLDPLMRLMRQHPCLIVLDKTEILEREASQSQTNPGQRGEVWQAYRDLLNRLTEYHHPSCLVWVARQRPILLGANSQHYCDFPISGFSKPDGIKWLSTQPRLVGSADDHHRLLHQCGGVPRLLQGAINTILVAYNGRIGDLLIPKNLERFVGELTQEAFLPDIDCFSPVEQQVLYWLALAPHFYDQLRHRFGAADLDEFGEALRSLRRRHLLQESEMGEPLISIKLPLLQTAIRHRFVKKLIQEIWQQTPQLLHQYPVMLATAADSLRWEHDELIVQAIAKSFESNLVAAQKRFSSLLKLLKQPSQLGSANTYHSYAGSNLINLAIALGFDLSIWEFTGLPLSHLDLHSSKVASLPPVRPGSGPDSGPDKELPRLNLVQSRLDNVRFDAGLQGEICGAISADGSLIAIGDETGHILIWRYQRCQGLMLINQVEIPDPVKRLTFCAETSDTLAIADDRGQVYYVLDIQRSQFYPPAPIAILGNSPITVISSSAEGRYAAVGRQDGSIVVWDCITGLVKATLSAQKNPITALSFIDQDTTYLVSGSADQRNVHLWTIDEIALATSAVAAYSPQVVPAYPNLSPYFMTGAVCCLSPEQIFLAHHHDRTITISTGYSTSGMQHYLSHTRSSSDGQDDVVAVAFSPSGRYVASSALDKTICIWDLEHPQAAEPIRYLQNLPQTAAALNFSRDGQFLLVQSRFDITLWDIHSGRQLRQFISQGAFDPGETPATYAGFNFQAATGLSDLERLMLVRQEATV
ncbi:MAG: NACHT and WD repeat domain-containing protein [Cyanobacteria bacterium P01_H01_bin.119]